MPVIFICILLLVLWIRYETQKTKRIGQKASAEFWEKERQANQTRNQNIDSLDYITVPVNELPLLANCEPELLKLQNSLLDISKEKIINLSNYTNTELKLKYGTGRFATLAQQDQNYTNLLERLNKLAEYHMEHNNPNHAITYFEYCVSYHSENPTVYVNLAKLYTDEGNHKKLDELKQYLLHSTFHNKDFILRKIEQGLLDHLL